MRASLFPVFSRRALGILAGGGSYPVLLAERLHANRIPFVVAGLKGQTRAALFPKAAAFTLAAVGELQKIAAFFKKHRALHIFFSGGVQRKNIRRNLRLDRAGASLLFSALFSGDDNLLRRCAEVFLGLGVEVIDPSPLLSDFFVPEGHLAGPVAAKSTLRDLALARETAAAWGKKDKGQAAVALDRKVIAREGRKGTDALIDQAGRPGAVLAKMVKPGQDRRFDLPAVGTRTVVHAHRAGITALGVEAGGVLLLDKEAVFSACNTRGISLYGLLGFKERPR